MIINLTKSVPLKEICRMSIGGCDSESVELIEFELSHEALIGFATELIWLYEDMQHNEKMIIETHQLKIDPSPSQVLGVYLTPDSPMFILKVNFLSQDEEEYKDYEEINIRAKGTNQYYNIKEPIEDNILERNGFICLETYELSKRNIINIRVLNKEKRDITSFCNTVVFEINHKGIKEFGTMLLVLANNYKEGQEYQFAQIGHVKEGYNLGVILVKDSIQAKIRCVDLGYAYDYDTRIG